MEFFQLQIYLKELIIQCENAEYAHEQLQIAIENYENDYRRVFFYVQAFLNHSVMISKIIWGTGDKKDLREFRQMRTFTIQEILQITASSPMNLKFMINNLEHFDEKLDSWSSDPNTFGNIIDHDLGSTYPMATVSGSSAKRFFRNFDPETETANLFGQYLDLRAMRIEMGRIKNLTRAKLEEFADLDYKITLSKFKES